MKQDREERAWLRAQRVHDLEHEAGLSRSIPCEGVGHLPLTDVYHGYFDADERRKFERYM